MEKQEQHHDPPLLLTINDLVRLLQISSRTIRRLRQEGQFPEPLQLRGSLRWKSDEIHEWIRQRCPSADA